MSQYIIAHYVLRKELPHVRLELYCDLYPEHSPCLKKQNGTAAKA